MYEEERKKELTFKITRSLAKRKKVLAPPAISLTARLLKNEYNVSLAIELFCKGCAQSLMKVFCAFQREGKFCCMSKNELAKETGFSTSAIKRAYDRLSKRGYILKINNGTTMQTNVYAVKVELLLDDLSAAYKIPR